MSIFRVGLCRPGGRLQRRDCCDYKASGSLALDFLHGFLKACVIACDRHLVGASNPHHRFVCCMAKACAHVSAVCLPHTCLPDCLLVTHDTHDLRIFGHDSVDTVTASELDTTDPKFPRATYRGSIDDIYRFYPQNFRNEKHSYTR